MSIKIGSTSEKINSAGGLIPAGQIIKKIGLEKGLSPFTLGKTSRALRASDAVGSMIGLHLQGYNEYDSIELFRKNPFFADSLGLKLIPSSSALRQNLSGLSGKINTVIREANLALLNTVKDFGKVTTSVGELIPVDIDVSPLDNSKSNKEKVGRTYKGHDGFAPIFAYIGADGYMLDCELRPGTQHCQKNTPAFIQKCLEHLDSLGLCAQSLVRLDSGNDSADTIMTLYGKCPFIIKRNLRRESPEQWLAHAKAVGKVEEPRTGKLVYTGTVEHRHPGNDETLPRVPIAFKVTVRSSDYLGNDYLLPKIDVQTYWTTLPVDAKEVISLYHDHGTSEQFHSEFKSDMGIERLPSHAFAANQLNLDIAMLSFNILRYIGQEAVSMDVLPVKSRIKRRRLRTVMRDIIMIAGKYVYHADMFTFKVWEKCPWLPVLEKLQAKLTA